jgi:hypothetical protein
MTPSSLRPARPVMFLLTLALTVACTSAPAVAQSASAPTPGATTNGSTPTTTPPPTTTPSVPGTGGGSAANPGGGSGSGTSGPGVSAPGGAGGSGPTVVDPTDPNAPITSGPVDPNPPVPDDGWKAVGATPGLTNLRPQAWDHISISPDGKTLTVYFWSGVEACYGLSEVRVADQGRVPTVTIITGTRDLPADFACIDLAQGFKTTITLDQPLVLDGSQIGRE